MMHSHLVDPEAFVAAMDARWRDGFGNVSSPALRAVWLQIATAFNDQVACPRLPRPVLAAELGAGKTTTAKVYCSMLTERTAHPGVLIVVRTKDQAEEYAREINEWASASLGEQAGAGLAFAYHSGLRPQPKRETLKYYPVLVICHRGYELSLDAQVIETHEKYAQLMQWRAGARRLVIIDEALEQVQVARLAKDAVQRLLGGSIPGKVLREHETARRILLSALDVLLGAPAGNNRTVPVAAMLKGAGVTAEEADAALAELWQAVRGSNKVKPRKRKNAVVLEAKDVRREVGEALTALRHQLNAYRWTEGEQVQVPAIISSRLLLPPDAGQVILDATGALNSVYRGLPEEYAVQPMLAVRDYRAVTLYAGQADGTGKWAMQLRPREIAQETLDAVLAHYGERAKERKVLVITNQKSEETVREVWSTGGFAALDVAHWNRIDGRNDWRDFDTLVTVTLNWGRVSMDLSTYMAVHGVELDDDGLNTPPDEVRAIRETRLAAQLAQAIGRIRLRRMVHEDGSCDPCDVFIRVPRERHRLADPTKIIEGIRLALRGIQVKTWGELDTPLTRGRAPKVTIDVAAGLLAYAGGMPQDTAVTVAEVRQVIGAKGHGTWFRLQQRALAPGDPVHAGLAAVGARIVPKSGRGPARLVRGAGA